MSKIVVVQPDRMLRQALTMALFPNHQVQMFDALPKVAPSDFDVMIVDLTALRERKSVTDGDLAVLQRMTLPLLIIEGDSEDKIVNRANLVRLKRPVAKEILQKALADCLSGATATKPMPEQRSDAAANSKRKTTRQKTPASIHPPSRYIELVDVVEEGVLSMTKPIQTRTKN